MPTDDFDVKDRHGRHQDGFGTGCADLDEAREQVQIVLPEIARGQVSFGERHVIAS